MKEEEDRRNACGVFRLRFFGDESANGLIAGFFLGAKKSTVGKSKNSNS
jgi:hypothetical protein